MLTQHATLSFSQLLVISVWSMLKYNQTETDIDCRIEPENHKYLVKHDAIGML